MELTVASANSTATPNVQRVLVHDSSKCTACCTCMIACAMRHFGVADLEKSFIRIVFNEELRAFEAVYCHHCDNPYCLNVCPVDAISKDEVTGIVRINPLICIGCGSCTFACPLGIPRRDPQMRVAVKCDLCEGDPECVKQCPTQALRYVPREEAYAFLTGKYR